MNTGDPLADAVVAAIHEDSSVRAQLNKGTKDGLASVENPHPSIVNLLTHCETIPDFAPSIQAKRIASFCHAGTVLGMFSLRWSPISGCRPGY